MPGPKLKTPAEALDLLILSIDRPLLKPLEVIQLLEDLPDSEKPKFGAAMKCIGEGLRVLKDVRENLAG